jgi:hypothetical protein
MPTLIRRRLISESSDTTAVPDAARRPAALVNIRRPDHQKTATKSITFL